MPRSRSPPRGRDLDRRSPPRGRDSDRDRDLRERDRDRDRPRYIERDDRSSKDDVRSTRTRSRSRSGERRRRYDDERERERERRAVELDDRGANARRQELRRQDKEEEEAEAMKKSEEEAVEMAGDDEDVEAAIMRKMGMPVSFDTSHNKKVEGNYSGLVKRDTKRSARQYMNRIGGFNRPLPEEKTHRLMKDGGFGLAE